MMPRLTGVCRVVACVAIATIASVLSAQAPTATVPLRDLTITEGGRPVRLVGYGLVTGLPGTGDRVTGGAGARHTVQSIVNLLRNFDLQVPPEMLRTRNVAAVLVTAEVSPYLREGGRFDIQVSSIGDAQTLRGGILRMTPLVAEAGGEAIALAQGPLLTTEAPGSRLATRHVNAARITDGGVMERSLPIPERSRDTRLWLRQPDLGLAQRIAVAIKETTGIDAKVEDPGSVVVELPRNDANATAALARLGDVRVRPTAVSRILVDARDGTVVAGADLVVLDGVISADGITLSIGGVPGTTTTSEGELPTGARVSDIAEALRSVRATPQQSAAVFLALRDAGAIRAEVIIR